MRFLIVEDEAYIAEMLRRSLEALGERCIVARDAETADEMLRDYAVDAVTLDLSMPGTPGLSWLEGLARTRPALARKTLVITGQNLEADTVERLARCGAGVLAKPFTLESLGAAVRSQTACPAAGCPD